MEQVETVRAPRGRDLHCNGWHQEAALRMLMNNLDPEVAEKPDELIVYGGTGKAARNWDCYHAIVRTLKRLENDETLLVQSGKPVGVFRTHPEAPRVLIANSHLVPRWANWDEFRRLEQMGLTMYGQMTAGSWIYIGTQGILQGTFETFAECARQHFGGTLAGQLLVTAGLGGMGGAQPLAATMNAAAFLGVEVDPKRIERRVETGYCDRMCTDLDEALDIVLQAKSDGEAVSVGLLGNIADVLPKLVRRDIVPDVLTDQTSAHDLREGYIPSGYSVEEAATFREEDPEGYDEAVLDAADDPRDSGLGPRPLQRAHHRHHMGHVADGRQAQDADALQRSGRHGHRHGRLGRPSLLSHNTWTAKPRGMRWRNSSGCRVGRDMKISLSPIGG